MLIVGQLLYCILHDGWLLLDDVVIVVMITEFATHISRTTLRTHFLVQHSYSVCERTLHHIESRTVSGKFVNRIGFVGYLDDLKSIDWNFYEITLRTEFS